MGDFLALEEVEGMDDGELLQVQAVTLHDFGRKFGYVPADMLELLSKRAECWYREGKILDCEYVCATALL